MFFYLQQHYLSKNKNIKQSVFLCQYIRSLIVHYIFVFYEDFNFTVVYIK